MTVISISLTGDLLNRLDDYVQDKGYSSRSEAIRDSIRQYLSDNDIHRFIHGSITATITVVSEHENHDIDEKLTRLRHEHNNLVTGNMHLHLSEHHCLEVFIAKGEAEDIMNFVGRIRALKDIQQVRYTITSLTT
ncbi:MAG: nickel-responsive transcriptional regulator NikR [Thaumarchaeota archaeon]|nr:nickel-responsive transcriptional regulator NikR [Nitrososphaerota archaeon]MCL5317104.1 nickel-responsive transcriptional regulator NikR [Nitrososphaerota archaeon]